MKKNYLVEILKEYGMENLDGMNYFELMEVKKRLEKKYNKFKGKIIFYELLNDIYNNLMIVQKYINKFNNYRTVKIIQDGNYDYDKTVYIIKGSKTKETLTWLNKNGLKVGYDRFNCYSDYDCTGDLSSQSIEVKGDRVIIEKWYDL